MYKSFKVGAAAVLLAGLVAGCAEQPIQGASRATGYQTANNQTGYYNPTQSAYNHVYSNDYLYDGNKRQFLSKCDQMRDETQRQGCYSVERMQDGRDVRIDN